MSWFFTIFLPIFGAAATAYSVVESEKAKEVSKRQIAKQDAREAVFSESDVSAAVRSVEDKLAIVRAYNPESLFSNPGQVQDAIDRTLEEVGTRVDRGRLESEFNTYLSRVKKPEPKRRVNERFLARHGFGRDPSEIDEPQWAHFPGELTAGDTYDQNSIIIDKED